MILIGILAGLIRSRYLPRVAALRQGEVAAAVLRYAPILAQVCLRL